MTSERTIYDEMIDNLENKIRQLNQNIKKLNEENTSLRKDIDATIKSMADTPWNEQAEARNDVRYYEGMIEINDKMIKMYQTQIQDLQDDIQQAINLQKPEKNR